MRPHVPPCSAFGGRSRKTGLLVGTRHRWEGPKWGRGECIYCGMLLSQVLAPTDERPEPSRGDMREMLEASRREWPGRETDR